MAIPIETVRSRVLLRVTMGLALFWLVLMAFGFIPTMVKGDYGVFSLQFLPLWWNAITWGVTTPIFIILLFVVIERTESWRSFSAYAIVLFVVVFLTQTASGSVVRALVDETAAPPTVVAFRLMIFLLFSIEAWSVIVFVSIISKLGLDTIETHLETTTVRRRTIEASIREQFVRTQPARLVSRLRRIAAMIPLDQDRATTELVGLGDYLRDLLRHSRNSSVTVSAELDTWRIVRGQTDVEMQISEEALDLEIPAGLLVAILERIGEWSPGARVLVESETTLDLRVISESVAKSDGVETGLSAHGLEPSRVSGREVRVSFSLQPADESEVRSGTSTLFTGTSRSWLWAVGSVFGVALFAGSVSAGQIAIGRWAGWSDLPLEFSLPAWVELAEWGMWGLVGVICMTFFLRRSNRPEWMGAAALLTWLILPHLIWGVVIDRLSYLDFMASFEYTFEQWDFALRSGFVIIGAALFRYLREIEDSIEEIRRLDEARGDYRMTRLRMIRAQLQPHFLLNALHAVTAMIAEDPGRAVRLAENICLLLEETAARVEKGYLRLGEEIEMARRYLDVLSMRYEDRLIYAIEWDEQLSDVEIPALATQPLLENAMVHGVEASLSGTRIDLRVESADGHLVITVTNPARPGVAGRARIGLGLANTEQTLRLCYGEDYRFEAGIIGASFVARMQIPKRRCAA